VLCSFSRRASKKIDKYDRQLRLWGFEGQRSLANAHVLCFGMNAAATETLKNLVLPGLGYFTIVAGGEGREELVNEEDRASNFFVSKIGESKGEAVVRELLELNSDVKGQFIKSIDPLLFLKGAEEFLKTVSLVIIEDSGESVEDLVREILRMKPLMKMVYLKSAGLLGCVKLIGKQQQILESRQEERNFPDLRISRPFESLKQFCDSMDLNSLPDHLHAHVPWVVLQMKAGNAGNAGSMKEGLTMLRRSADELNFDEADENVYVGLHDPTELSEETKNVFDAVTDEMMDEFSVVVRAIKKFVTVNGVLPLNGAIPDMTADTKSFLALQQIYLEKAKSDLNEIRSYLEVPVGEGVLERLVKNASGLKVMDFNRPGIECDEPEALLWYQGLVEGKITGDSLIDEEVQRASGGQLHAVSAVIGGVAAQEAVKLITSIFTPLDNCWIYCALKGHAWTIKI
jgi:NEDD8-activating enzyme E1 regulatory subunit